MKSLLMTVFATMAICSACTPMPSSPGGRSMSSSDGVSVYGVIDAGVVLNH